MDEILDRVATARLLMLHNRYFDAFLLGLIAFAGVSRRRYPKTTEYNIYFTKKCGRHHAQSAEIQAARLKRADQVTRNPKRRFLSDRETFQCLVFDEIGNITGPNLKHPPTDNVVMPFGPDLKPMNFEDILYEYFRCTSVHEGRFPATVEMTDPEMVCHDGAWQLANVVRLTKPNGWPKGWVENIVSLIERCPEVR